MWVVEYKFVGGKMWHVLKYFNTEKESEDYITQRVTREKEILKKKEIEKTRQKTIKPRIYP